MSSPRKKKTKVGSTNELKRQAETDRDNKRQRSVSNNVEEDLQARKRRNFVLACEQVSHEAYFDHCTRLQLIYLPSCTNIFKCKHHGSGEKVNIKQMPSYAEESFNIEMKTNMWCEALEVCHMCIRPNQYLSMNVLRGVVEIIMNAHEDEFADYTGLELIDKCQEILALHFSTHPPCLVKDLRSCYNSFLTAPMDPKQNTFTNRLEFQSEKGLVAYCMNRLEYEISEQSRDGPLVDKYENIPEEMKQSVKGLHWQKEKFEIFELLERSDRIERLMYVLESIIELMQFDLTIWLSRYANNISRYSMRSDKPLMAHVLWSNNVLYTGAVNNLCRQILRLFVYLIHLQYPEAHIRIISMWVNTIIQTFYIYENNSNNDYPNIGKYCTAFAKEFYRIISEMPHESIIRVIENIQPTFMQYLIGMQHIKIMLHNQEDCIIKTLINFIKETQWNMFHESKDVIKLSRKLFTTKKVKNKLNYFAKICRDLTITEEEVAYINNRSCPKLILKSKQEDPEISRNYIIHVLYVTLEAYLDAYSVQAVQEKLDTLNEQLLQNDDASVSTNDLGSYCVTEYFIKKYRSICQLLKELILLLNEQKTKENLPQSMNIFANIGLEF